MSIRLHRILSAKNWDERAWKTRTGPTFISVEQPRETWTTYPRGLFIISLERMDNIGLFAVFQVRNPRSAVVTFLPHLFPSAHVFIQGRRFTSPVAGVESAQYESS